MGILVLVAAVMIIWYFVLRFLSTNKSQSVNDENQAQKSNIHIDRAAPLPTVVKKESAFQKIFLGNIFNKIGAMAIIFALIFFIKYVSSLFILTPLIKFIIAFCSGIFMIGFGLSLHNKEYFKSYSEVLMGTGFATLYITTFCGYSVFKVLSPILTVLMGGVLLICAYSFADRMKTYSMMVIGILGGYLTPFFSGVDTGVIISFFIFLNLITLVYSLKNTKAKFINVINLFVTMVIITIYNVTSHVEFIYPLVLWGIYVIYDILRDKTSKIDNGLIWVNYFVLVLFTIIMNHANHNVAAALFGISALGYYILVVLSKLSKNNLYKHYAHCALINVWMLVFFVLNDVYSILVWSIVALFLSIIIEKRGSSYLKPVMWFYYASMFIGTLVIGVDGKWCLFAHYNPVINYRTLMFSAPIIAMVISAYIFKNKHQLSSNILRFGSLNLLYIYLIGEMNSLITHWNLVDTGFSRILLVVILGFLYSIHSKILARKTGFVLFNVVGIFAGIISLILLLGYSYAREIFYLYPSNYKVILNYHFLAYLAGLINFITYARWTKGSFYKYLALIVGFLLVHFESVGVKNVFSDKYVYLISLCWILYAGIITIWGIVRNQNYLKVCGIIFSILTFLRIIICDIPKVDTVYKFLIFFVLGVVFMLMSYLYTAKKR